MDLMLQDRPKPKIKTAPNVPRIRVTNQSDWNIDAEGRDVKISCRTEDGSVVFWIDHACAAWLSGTLRVHATRAGRIAGGPGGAMVRNAAKDISVPYDTLPVRAPNSFVGSNAVAVRIDWKVEHEGELVKLIATKDGARFEPRMEAETAAWLAAALRRAVKAVRYMNGFGRVSTTIGLLSNAEIDYKLGLDKDR